MLVVEVFECGCCVFVFNVYARHTGNVATHEHAGLTEIGEGRIVSDV